MQNTLTFAKERRESLQQTTERQCTMLKLHKNTISCTISNDTNIKRLTV